ncbi:hypothetical protein ELO44_28205 [Klebsiella pneumoniae]|nr:hypothetical protein [Klebsiella pneumoniae]
MKSPSCRMGFLRFCRPASVPVCLPGGAAPTGATGLSRSVARTGTPRNIIAPVIRQAFPRQIR